VRLLALSVVKNLRASESLREPLLRHMRFLR